MPDGNTVYNGPKKPTLTPAAIAQVGSIEVLNEQAGATLIPGNIVFLDGSSITDLATKPRGWKLADAYAFDQGISSGSRPQLGMVATSALSGSGVRVVMKGVCSAPFGGTTTGGSNPIYLRSGGGAPVTISPPAATSGVAIVQLGYVLAASSVLQVDSVWFDPRPPVVLGILS